MKKSLVALMLTAMTAIALTGCSQAPQSEQKQPDTNTEVKDEVTLPEPEVVLPEPEVVQPTGKVSENSVAGRMTNEVNWEVYEGDLLSTCSLESVALNQKLKDYGVKMNPLHSTMYSAIVVYKTANPDKSTKAELEAIVSPCAELGSKQVLKVTDDYILLGYPSCTAGVLPDPELQPEQYNDYVDCSKIEKDLKDYLELDLEAI